jgi:prophage tail gpP-like protein
MKKLLIICAVFAFGVAALLPTSSHGQRADHGSKGEETKAVKFRTAKNPIPDQYIVVFHDWATGEKGEHSVAAELADSVAAGYGARVDKTFKHALNGFAGRMSKETALALSDDPRVAFVEENQL